MIASTLARSLAGPLARPAAYAAASSMIPRGAMSAARLRGLPTSSAPCVRGIHLAADSAEVADTVPSADKEPFEITLSDQSFSEYKLDEHGGGPSLTMETSKEELVRMYATMAQMRRMEMAADALYKQKFIRGFCHLAMGQEAVATGMHSAMSPEDLLITSYRCHPFAALRGGSIAGVLAELFGRDLGLSQGKGGSMHMFTKTFFGGNGIVGAQVPVGTGLALTQKYNNTQNAVFTVQCEDSVLRVVVLLRQNAVFTLYGDGASNQGQVFEAMNMAQLWKLPCVYVCENNKYGMGTSAERSSMNTKFYTRGDVIPGLQVNAMDVLAVRQATAWARNYTIQGNGPLIMELVTYRYGGHSLSDPGTTYRTREEIQRMRTSADPISGLKNKILEWGVVSEDELKAIDKQAKSIVDQAIAEAKAAPEPPAFKLWEDVYVKGLEPPKLRGRITSENHFYEQA